MSHPMVGEPFQFKNVLFNGEQEQNHLLCEDGIEKSVPRNHRLSSFGKPRDPKQ